MERRIDPFFKLRTPLLFAHRGGAKEQPESTLKAFKYALNVAHVDVLELDVQVTRDNPPQFVVWHGPGLKNVSSTTATAKGWFVGRLAPCMENVRDPGWGATREHENNPMHPDATSSPPSLF